MTARNELTWIDFIWWVSLPSRFVLELMIVIEDRFADVVITDEEVDQLEVGDLIRHIENVDHERRRHSIVEATTMPNTNRPRTWPAVSVVPTVRRRSGAHCRITKASRHKPQRTSQ